MKKSIRTALLSFAALLCIGSAQAQTMTGAILTQPCNNNGNLSVSVTGLTPPINYTYTNWVANQTVVHSGIASTSDNLTGIGAYNSQWINANIWTVYASDGTSSASQSFTLTAPFSIGDSVFVASCPASSSVQAFFSGGTAPYSCVWTNLNNSMVFTTNPAAVPNGPYSLVATDGAGCMVATATNSSSIYVYSTSGIYANISGSPANCTNGTATVNATGGTAPYTYLWSNGAVTQSLSGLSMGQYTCTVTDAIGCQSTGYYYQQQTTIINFNSTTTNATCVQNNGAILGFVNGGTAPYSFMWSNGATTQNLTGLTGGQPYNVQIADANGCLGSGYVYVGVTTPISVTYSTTASSCTAATGSATLTPTGGVGPYTILWYTSPSTSGPSISSKPSGTYSFKVTDANGCIQTGSAYIPPVSTINANLANNTIYCPATTGNLVTSTSGSNPPFTYAWSNAATTSSLTGVPLGAYTCTITDAVGCKAIKYGSVTQTSPINVGFTSTQASCIFATNGSVTANATGGTAPYTYTWSNSQTGSSATGLATGNYYVWVTDANGCNNSYYNSQVYVGYNAANNSCYCTITGTVYADANSNCVRNTGESGIPNVQIHCSGLGYTYTDANGVYSFIAPSGTYSITESIQQIYPLAPCQSNNQTVTVVAATNCSSTVNFANNVILLHDLRIITTNMNLPIPGNTYTQKVIVQNDGSATESTVKLGYAHDGQLSFTSCTPWALTQPNALTYPDWYSMSSGFPSLIPGASSTAFMNYNVAANVPLNTLVNVYDTVSWNAPIYTSWLTDNTPWNNVNNHQALVVGSYDPNFKEVSPQGTGPQGNITNKDSVLTYVIHFQNTGSYFADNVVVTDTLDSDLNIASLHPGYSDHQYTTTITENGAVRFTFNNIHLPWKSGYGDALSSGMFTYSVKLKKNRPVGTQIKNKAAIYFDHNDPIITNTTLNTIAAAPVSVKELKADGDGIMLYPNPANNYFTMTISSQQNASGVLHIYDISGREVSAKNVELHTGENSLTENTSQLQSGIYLVQLKAGDLQIGKKLIIAK